MVVSARTAAARALEHVFAGRALDDALALVVDQVETRERALLFELAYGVCRWSQQLEALLDRLLKKRLKASKRSVEQIMRVGLYQLFHTRIPAHAAIDESVKATRQCGQDWAAGLVNAVLRRAQRDQHELLAAVMALPDVSCGLPHWLRTKLAHQWSTEQLQAICGALLERPPLTLRVNLTRTSLADYAKRLEQADIANYDLPNHPAALVLETAVGVDALPGFAAGDCSVQDAGAQLAAVLLAPSAGDKVLDACAAPGGKSTHLLEFAPSCHLTAVDSDAGRLQRVTENLTRLGLHATTLVADLRTPQQQLQPQSFDRILLDAPCSATGVIRRHPDIRLLRRATDIASLEQLQARILAHCWQLLRPGGRLLYVTCSILAEENWLQMANFIAQHADARELPVTHPDALGCEHGMQVLPGTASMDGFYFALVEKLA